MPTLSPSLADLADYFSKALQLNGTPAMASHHEYYVGCYDQLVVQQPGNAREAAALLTFTAMQMESRLSDSELAALKGVLAFIVEHGALNLTTDPFDQFFPGGLQYPNHVND